MPPTTLAAGRADLENVETMLFLGGGCLRLMSINAEEPVERGRHDVTDFPVPYAGHLKFDKTTKKCILLNEETNCMTRFENRILYTTKFL